jgi:hypothetical protein
MFRSMASKVAWVGRTASMVFGLALVLALILGVVTMAAAAVPGDPFKLGQYNRVDGLTVLASTLAGPVLRVDNEGSGPALDLRVGDPRTDPFNKTVAPMKVDSPARVDFLNADRLDGKSASRIGVNGLRVARDQSDADDSSPVKRATAVCPNARDRLVVVGTGYRIKGAPNGNVVMTVVDTFAPRGEPKHPNGVLAVAKEAEPYDGNWSVEAEAICATDGTPLQVP